MAIFAPLALFAATLGLAAVLMLCLPAAQRWRLAAWLNVRLRRRLPASRAEVPKFALLRVAFGALLSWRAWNVLSLLAVADLADPWVFGFALSNLIAALLILFGCLTQWALAWSVLVQWCVGDAYLGTSTLANDIATMLAVHLFLVQAGRMLSFDALLLRTGPRWRLGLLYPARPAGQRTLRCAKFIALSSYWLLCLYSLSMHLNEPAWMRGIAGPLLLSSNFMSRYHAELSIWFAQSEHLVLCARAMLWAMLPWYAMVLPGVLIGRWARWYVITWGVLFFCVSALVLQLGMLAEIEFVLWLALFWTGTGIRHRSSVRIVYDDECKLCSRTVRVINGADLFGRTSLHGLSKSRDLLQRHGVDARMAGTDLVVLDRDGRVHFGYASYLCITHNVIVLWPLLPLLYMGRLFKVGPRIYACIARRRIALFGACPVAPFSRARGKTTAATGRSRDVLLNLLLCHFLGLAVAFLWAMPAPYLGKQGSRNLLTRAADITYGVNAIDVFNQTDLKMAENWFTLSELTAAGEQLLPVLAPDGSRLGMHRSDRIYFGNTLHYRRANIDRKGCFWEHESARMSYLVQVYLRTSGARSAKSEFVYRQYFRALPDLDNLNNNYFELGPASLRCEMRFSL